MEFQPIYLTTGYSYAPKYVYPEKDVRYGDQYIALGLVLCRHRHSCQLQHINPFEICLKSAPASFEDLHLHSLYLIQRRREVRLSLSLPQIHAQVIPFHSTSQKPINRQPSRLQLAVLKSVCHGWQTV